MSHQPGRDEYTVAWVCALPVELVAARSMLDERYDAPNLEADENWDDAYYGASMLDESYDALDLDAGEKWDDAFYMGSIAGHNVVIACLPWRTGTTSAAALATRMQAKFRGIRFILMVGIGGGVPSHQADIRLGDVVVSMPQHAFGGVVQHDLGKTTPTDVTRTGSLATPHPILLSAAVALQSDILMGESKFPNILSETERISCLRRCESSDVLYEASYDHEDGPTCAKCLREKQVVRSQRLKGQEVVVHHGTIASGNQVMKSAAARDKISQRLGGVLCFEMEAAGLMNDFPCIVIRGISDYADSHRNNHWQGYAASTAAAYAKALLLKIPPAHMTTLSGADEIIGDSGIQASTRKPANKAHIHQSPKGHEERQPLNKEQKQRLLDSLWFEQLDDRKNAIKRAHAETCEWLFNNTHYLDWLDATKIHGHHGFLWIKGNPGAGKSTLMKFAFNKSYRADENNLVLSFFFNERGSKLEKSTVGVYRSLLRKLLLSFPALQDVFETLYTPTSSFDANHNWSVESLKTLLEEAIQRLENVSVVCFIDALNECDETEIRDMVRFFEHVGDLSIERGISFLICFSSRHYPHITIRKGLELVLEGQEGHAQDITNYIETELKIGKSKKAQQIRAAVQEKAAGIFMWVVLVVGILNKESDRGRVDRLQQKLREIPSDLYDLFRDILTRDSNNKEELVLCIQWVLFAKQALSPEQLYYAILSGVEPDAVSAWDPEEIDQETIKRFILDCSKGLTDVTASKNQKVQFIHESVRDFLFKEEGLSKIRPEYKGNFLGHSHERLKQCCSAYLEIGLEKSLDIPEPLPKASSHKAKELRLLAGQRFPLLEYAVRNIFYHSDLAEGYGMSQEKFVNNSKQKLVSWVRLRNVLEKFETRKYRKEVSLLYVLAELDCANLIRSHFPPEDCLRVEDERYGCPLLAACALGNNAAMQALSSDFVTTPTGRDADYNQAQHVIISTPAQQSHRDFLYLKDRPLLFNAAHICPEWLIIRLLNSSRCMSDTRSSDLRSVLEIVSKRGLAAVVEKLLGDHASDFDMASSCEGRSMYLAAENGHESVIKSFVLKFPDIDLRHWIEKSIHVASEKGFENVVMFLLDEQPDLIEGENSKNETPLYLAVSNGHPSLARTLLLRGANIHSRPGSSGTILAQAALKGFKDIVMMLLDSGAEIDWQASDHESPLHAACRGGQEEIVKLLLERGANVNIQGGLFGNALQAACREGHEEIVKLLVERGAYINAQGGEYGNALHAACTEVHRGIVELLLEGGADVNAKGGKYGNALQAASYRGNPGVVELLLRKGADVNAQGGHYGSALQAASAGGYKEIMTLLLDKGANATSADEDCSDALPDDAKSYAQDSGYATASKATTETLINQDPDSDEVATVVSAFTVNESDDYVSEIANDLFVRFAFNSFDSQTLEQVYDALHSQLKALALKLGYDTEDQKFRNIMVFIYSHESQIVECLKELVSTAGSKQAQFNRTQFTQDWLRGDTTHDATIGLESHVQARAIAQDPSHELSHFQPDDDAGNINSREVSRYGHLVFEEPAYTWFLACIERERSMDSASTDLAKAIRNEISASFPSLRVVSRRRSAQSYKATFQIQWDPHAFIEDEGYKEAVEHVVETAITLTGSLTDAQALTCSEYLHQTWPTSGKSILQLIKSVVASRRGQKHICNLPDRTKIIAWIIGSVFMVETVGTARSVAEVGEQFAWIGSALRSSPYRYGVACYTPRLVKLQHSHETAKSSEHFKSGQVRFDMHFSVQSQSDHLNRMPCQCWHDMFRNPVVVGGYPIPRRLEANTGLEIPLNMMAGLLNTVRADVFDGKVFIKSHSSMLVPTRQTGDLVLWHFLQHKNGEPISYRHNRGSHALIHFSALEDPKVRHIVGWLSKAKILSGKLFHANKNDTRNNIEWKGASEAAKCVDNSRLRGPFRGCALEHARIVKQIYIGHGAAISYGDKDGRREGFNDSLGSISGKYVILWDVESKRGWMMNGTTAFLHLLRASLELNRTGQLSSNCSFEQAHIQEVETLDQCNAALQILLNPDNGSLPIFRDDTTTVKDRIKDFIYIFESMFTWEENSDGKRPGSMTSKGETFECLEGWDFRDLASRKYPVIPRFENLRTGGRSWIELSRSLQAVTIFGKGLGELIQPVDANRLCKYWERLPSERYYLAAMVSDVQRMLDEVHNRPGEPRSLLAEILWHQTDRSAEFCQCSEHDLEKHADVVEILKPLDADGEPEEIYWFLEENSGAVCFGNFSTEEPHAHAANGAKKIVQSAQLVARGRPDELNCERTPRENQTTTTPGRPVVSRTSLKRKRSLQEISDAEDDIVTDPIQGSNNRMPPRRPDDFDEFQVAIICALTIEADAVQALFDGTWNDHDQPDDDINTYSTGWIGPHAVVLVHLAGMGKEQAATAAVHLKRTCKRIKLGLVVGICGGIPSPEKIPEILLGDVVVSTRIMQHDLGKQHETGFISKQTHDQGLTPSNCRVRSFQNKLEGLLVQERLRKLALSYVKELCRGKGPLAGKFVYPGLDKDKLYRRNYHHKHHDSTACASGKCLSHGLKKKGFCESASRTTCADLRCDTQMLIVRTRIENARQRARQYSKGKPKSRAKQNIPEEWSIEHPTITSSEPWIHFGSVASGDTVMKSSKIRDKVAQQNCGLRAFEMEGTGVCGTLPTIVVKGVCDYSDSHKNDDWHWYAAGTAAACTKALLYEWAVRRPQVEHRLCKRARY